jgi:hypothetical protein
MIALACKISATWKVLHLYMEHKELRTLVANTTCIMRILIQRTLIWKNSREPHLTLLMTICLLSLILRTAGWGYQTTKIRRLLTSWWKAHSNYLLLKMILKDMEANLIKLVNNWVIAIIILPHVRILILIMEEEQGSRITKVEISLDPRDSHLCKTFSKLTLW